MSDKPKRQWFQIHLSTLVLLMFIAGGILWVEVSDFSSIMHRYSGWDKHVTRFYGFPACAYEFEFVEHFTPVDTVTVVRTDFRLSGLLINIISGPALLAFVAYGIEAAIARYDAKISRSG